MVSTTIARDISIAWDRQPSHTNLLQWEITLNGTNLFIVPTNQTTFVITNVPCGVDNRVFAYAVNVDGLHSDPSNLLIVRIPCAPVIRLQLEASDDLNKWNVVSNLYVRIEPVELAGFYRVKVPTIQLK